MSWPPLIYPDHHNRPWAYSFVVSFTVQTVPFHSKPVIHCDIGLRRWVSDRVYLPGGEETSVYLLSAVPWLKGVHQSHAFQVAPMKWVPLKRSEGGDGQRGMLVWGNAVAPLLNDLNLQTPLPSPESLRDNPVAGLNVDGTPSAAVVYRNAMGRSHGVGAGVTPNDRRGILEWITSELSDYVRPTQPLHRVDIPVQRQRRAAHPVANVPVVNNSAAEDRRAHRLALVRATRGVLSVDILHQSFPMLQSLLETMRDDLGLPDQALVENGKQLLRWETPELTVIARAHPLGSVGAPLDIDTSGRRYANVGRATDVRADEVCRLLKGEGGTAALVELGGADEYARDADPKDAIRLGCARAGAVSQFITPYKRGVGEEAGTGHKAKHAWLDLVRRQLGVQIAPPRIALAGVEMPHPLHYVGVWLVKQFSTAHQGGLQHQIPVMVKLSSDSLDILATAPGLEGWLPYPQALRSLAQCDPFVVGRRDDGQVMDFIKDAMENDILPLGDVLLLTDAQNLRGAWKYLANNQLDLDRLTFGPAMPQSIRTWPGLRHVRIRTDEGSETPECFAINGEDYGFSAGLWAADPAGRVFASTGRKPGTFKQSARVSKIRSYTTSKSSSGKRPKLHAWNHQLVEITVAAIQPGDTPWVWAAETHELRSVAPHHNEMMTRPLPLHLARLMGEYVIPIANR